MKYSVLEALRLVEEHRKERLGLSVLGFGCKVGSDRGK